ncbi:MAG: ROK family protein [Phycisphaerae bacterium]
MTDKTNRLYVGVDVGGTKTLAALATAYGEILARERRPTPREGGPIDTVAAIVQLISDLLGKNHVAAGSLGAIGLAVPGIVGDGHEEVTFAPNLNIAGVNVVAPLKEKFGAPTVLGNDVNLGTLGEKWLGAARDATSAVGIFVGTGIGGGIIQDGRLLTGHRGSAGEIGHIILQMGGPRCGCGGLGCLEALASRTAIERDLRQAMRDGRATVLKELAGARAKVIKSSVLAEALKKKDKVVVEVMRRASEALGQACVTVRHVLDPEVIILGGGVVEACGAFVLPIVQRIVARDRLLSGISKGKVVASELGDDAVVLGAVALAQQMIGVDPFKLVLPAVRYPRLSRVGGGSVLVGGRTYREDIHIRANGSVKKRRKLLAKLDGQANIVSAAEAAKLCKGMPSNILIIAGTSRPIKLAREAEELLRKRNLKVQVLPASEAPEAYNAIKGRKAALIHVCG